MVHVLKLKLSVNPAKIFIYSVSPKKYPTLVDILGKEVQIISEFCNDNCRVVHITLSWFTF